MKKITFSLRHLLPVFILLLSVNGLMAQQVIGYFNFMDGGFEGQTVAAVPASSTIAAGATSSTWTVTTAGVGTIQTSVARTGTKSCNFYTTSTTKRLQSPTLPSPAQQSAANTAYTIQYYYRTAGAVATAATMQAGLSSSGTTDGIYTTATVFAATSGVWTKYSTAFTTKASVTPSSPVGIIRETIAMITAIDIDDYCIYPGALDVTAPDAPTAPSIPSPAATQMTVSWTAAAVGAGNGVDGGGYMVVRSTVDPSAVPNVNGIYAVGNTVSDGVGASGTVVYLGTTGTSFNDTGLSPTTPYYYRIYSVDKAFNYSTPILVNATTTAPSYAAEPTAQVTGISFTAISSTGFTINWNAAVSGGGANHLVVVKTGSSFSGDPADGSSYTANTVLGSGSAVGGGTVVYNGAGTSVPVTGLLKGIVYYVRIYDFNGTGGSENYLITAPASGNQMASPGDIVSNGSSSGGKSWSDVTAWTNGVVPGQYDNVTIATGDIINVAASAKCYNLTIQSGAKLLAPSANTLQIYGSSLSCSGTLGENTLPTPLSSLTTEFGGNLTVTGAGLIYFYKIRPITGLSKIGVTFDANAEVTYNATAMQSDNVGNDSIYYTVKTGRTLTVDGNWSMASSTGTNSNATTIININGGGTAILAKAFATPVAAGKTCTVNIDGTLTGGTSCSPYSYTGGGVATFNINGTFTVGNFNVTPTTAVVAPVINIGSTGSLTVNGTADFSNTSLVGYIGNAPSTTGGTFTLGSGATINIVNASGLEPAAGPIRTSTRSFNIGANYSYLGTVAQGTGIDLPSTINNLTINNAAGVSIGATTTVSGSLALTSGKLSLGANDLTAAAITGASATNYIVTDGVGKLYQTTTNAVAKLFPVGTSTLSYDPVTITPTSGSATGVKVSPTLLGTVAAGVNYNPKEWTIIPAVPSSTTLAMKPSAEDATVASMMAMSPYYGIIGQYDGVSTYTITGLDSYSTGTYTATLASFAGGSFVNGVNSNATGNVNATEKNVNAYGVASQLIVVNTLAGDMISVYGLNGQTVAKVAALSNQTALNLNKGLYLVNVKSTDKNYNFKVVLK